MICWSRCASEAAVSTYVSATMAIEPTTKRVEYHSVSASGRRNLSDDIAHTAYGLQQVLLERSIDLVAESAHQDVDDVGLRIEVVFPYMGQDHRLRHDLARISHQVLEEREFTRAELDHRAAAYHLAGQKIERDVVDRDRGWLGGPARSAYQRLHPREKFCERERLREVVVAAGLQAAHPVVHGSSRAENQHGRRTPAATQLIDHAQPVALWQHQIDDSHVRVVFEGGRKSLFPIA